MRHRQRNPKRKRGTTLVPSLTRRVTINRWRWRCLVCLLIVLCQVLALRATAQSESDSAPVLPWSRPDQQQAKSPLELLALYGIGAEQLKSIVHYESLDDDEAAIVARLLYRLARFDPR